MSRAESMARESEGEPPYLYVQDVQEAEWRSNSLDQSQIQSEEVEAVLYHVQIQRQVP